MFCLHSPTAPSLDLPHPKRNSIHVPKCEPQTLGSSSIPTVEHMRGASDEITLWYIHKPTEIDWNCMLSGRQKGKKKVHCHLEVIYKTALHLVTKLTFPKHINISLNSEVIGSNFSSVSGQLGKIKLVIIMSQQNRKYCVLATDLLSR